MGDPEAPQELDQSTKLTEENEDVDLRKESEEEVGECGFCLFMKGGGCKDAFVAWENCIQDAENNNEDIVEKCFEVTAALKKCMEAHPDYYEPILQAEKAQEEEAKKSSHEEKGSNNSESNVTDKGQEEEARKKPDEEKVPNKSESNVAEKETE
ncbi:uncharacterized protein LOC8286502 [Ricinus communis]|uniref:uncharacterized protein LOC8286502 n=1 Tax=Ricinus communis TaxID=3988 RepID=UPI00201A5D3F|nr:uncharacterized protein LOC8286502 [Ricinus communis]XP_015578812.2 uncharacterized protein LOC8286502 [Ricinus communis]